ncbi:MAG: hypothetical protein IID05_04290 [Gemmatimonadetes bacterium]|nr:hypothetical protein [Gemmatimonadota bacterium]
MNPVVEEGLIVGGIVLLVWAVNQAFKLAGSELPNDWKKGLVLTASVGGAVLVDPFELGDPSLQPDYLAFLAGQAVIQFKAAQVIFDKAFKKLATA